METATELLRAPEIFKLFAGDPLFERVQEIKELIARRAYELSEARGFTHGQELEDWLRAQSEILRGSPVDIRETETELTIFVEVRSEEHTSELQSRSDLVCRLLLEKKKSLCIRDVARGYGSDSQRSRLQP